MLNNLGILFEEITTEASDAPQISISNGDFWVDKLDQAVIWITTYGIKLILAIIVLFFSFKIVNMLSRSIRKRMIAKNADKTLTSITYSFFRKGMKILLFLVFLTYVGVSATSIGAAVASLGVVIGLALQGGLSNLAGGIILVIIRPFRIGDYIEAQGEGGTVEEITIFYTYLTTPDNRTVMIPNGILANGVIRNNSLKDYRRVDFQFGVSYESNLELVKNTLMSLCMADDRIVKDGAKKPFVEIAEYAASSIEFKVRVWTKSENYWNLYFDYIGKVKNAFDEKGIEIPYQKLDVYVNQIEKKEDNF